MKRIVLFLLTCAISIVSVAQTYKDAAEQGDADAQFRLGVCYANGDGVAKNMT